MKIVCPPHQYDHVPLVLEMHLHTHTHTCSIQSVFLDLCNCNDYYAKRILIVIEKKVGSLVGHLIFRSLHCPLQAFRIPIR